MLAGFSVLGIDGKSPCLNTADRRPVTVIHQWEPAMTDSFEEAAQVLQRKLAEDDLLQEQLSRRSSGGMEHRLLLVRLQEMKLKMYQEDGHQYPHLHVDYGRRHHVGSFAIKPPGQLAGSLRRSSGKTVIEWINANQDELLRIWDGLQEGDDVESLVAELAADA